MHRPVQLENVRTKSNTIGEMWNLIPEFAGSGDRLSAYVGLLGPIRNCGDSTSKGDVSMIQFDNV